MRRQLIRQPIDTCRSPPKSAALTQGWRGSPISASICAGRRANSWRTCGRARRRCRQHEELEAPRREAARLLLPELLDLYINGRDQDREALRGLLARCPTFRWGFGWGLASHIATADDARRALAVLSMKDGGSDWRDE